MHRSNLEPSLAQGPTMDCLYTPLYRVCLNIMVLPHVHSLATLLETPAYFIDHLIKWPAKIHGLEVLLFVHRGYIADLVRTHWLFELLLPLLWFPTDQSPPIPTSDPCHQRGVFLRAAAAARWMSSFFFLFSGTFSANPRENSSKHSDHIQSHINFPFFPVLRLTLNCEQVVFDARLVSRFHVMADSLFVRTFDLIKRLVSADVGWRWELIHFRALESENKFAVFINPMAPHESPLNAFRSDSLAHFSPPGFQNEKCRFEAATARKRERCSERAGARARAERLFPASADKRREHNCRSRPPRSGDCQCAAVNVSIKPHIHNRQSTHQGSASSGPPRCPITRGKSHPGLERRATQPDVSWQHGRGVNTWQR